MSQRPSNAGDDSYMGDDRRVAPGSVLEDKPQRQGRALYSTDGLRGWWWVDGVVKKMQHLAALRYAVQDQQALRVDVDTRTKLSLRALADRLQKSNRRLSWVVERPSPSGRGWHRWIGVWPRPASAVEMVALQLVCGSDPHREAYNLNRARQVDSGQVSAYWRNRWNVFYKRERTDGTVEDRPLPLWVDL